MLQVSPPTPAPPREEYSQNYLVSSSKDHNKRFLFFSRPSPNLTAKWKGTKATFTIFSQLQFFPFIYLPLQSLQQSCTRVCICCSLSPPHCPDKILKCWQSSECPRTVLDAMRLYFSAVSALDLGSGCYAEAISVALFLSPHRILFLGLNSFPPHSFPWNYTCFNYTLSLCHVARGHNLNALLISLQVKTSSLPDWRGNEKREGRRKSRSVFILPSSRSKWPI